jgi:hypothetical protein
LLQHACTDAEQSQQAGIQQSATIFSARDQHCYNSPDKVWKPAFMSLEATAPATAPDTSTTAKVTESALTVLRNKVKTQAG